jgi:adenylate cyclase class IV
MSTEEPKPLTAEDLNNVPGTPELEKPKNFLEIEVKYNADDIDRIKFKDLAQGLNPGSFIYVESYDVYYVRDEESFLRYRMPATNSGDDKPSKRAELAFKRKHIAKNNIVRTEVNLRVDVNTPELVNAFCEGLGYKKNFSIYKMCDIYIFEDATLVYYSVKDESNKYAHFVEIEASEEMNLGEEAAWEIIQKYEKILSPLGITAQKRKRLSLYEMYKKEIK